MRKQVVEEVFEGSPARHFPTDVPKFPMITFEWQLLQLRSATFDQKC